MNKNIKIKNTDEIPYYLKDEYITNYVVGRNHSECITNLFKIHNESVNAWTMFISNLSVLLITIYIFMRTQLSRLYSFIFILHLFAHTIHTPFSVCYHTFNTINENEYIKWRKYDVYGIFLRSIILSFTISFFTYTDFKYVLLNTSLTLIVVYYSLLKFKESEDKHEPLDKIEQGKLIGYVVFTYLIPLIYKVLISIKNIKCHTN
jgi:adiponectin receptor